MVHGQDLTLFNSGKIVKARKILYRFLTVLAQIPKNGSSDSQKWIVLCLPWKLTYNCTTLHATHLSLRQGSTGREQRKKSYQLGIMNTFKSSWYFSSMWKLMIQKQGHWQAESSQWKKILHQIIFHLLYSPLVALKPTLNTLYTICCKVL